MYYLAKLYFILLIFTVLQTQAAETSRSFYAISSLCSHLNDKLSSDSSKTFFSDADLSAIWDTAGVDPACSNNVALAKECYDLATQENSPDADLLLMEAQALLESSWRTLNPYWSNSASLVEKRHKQFDFLLPKKSHLRKPLKKIFSDPNVLNSPETFAQAGFVTVSERRSGMFVASHPTLPGYLVKAYVVSKKAKPNWEWAVFRCWEEQHKSFDQRERI